MDKYVVVLQAFNIKDLFVVNEMCIVNLNNQNILHYLIDPPSAKSFKVIKRIIDANGVTRNSVHYIMKHLFKNKHMNNWYSEIFEHTDIFDDAWESIYNADLIFTVGKEETDFIFKMTGKIGLDLNYMQCPKSVHLPKVNLSQVIKSNFDPPLPRSLFLALKYKEWLTSEHFSKNCMIAKIELGCW